MDLDQMHVKLSLNKILTL